jgi:hypothetical protein
MPLHLELLLVAPFTLLVYTSWRNVTKQPLLALLTMLALTAMWGFTLENDIKLHAVVVAQQLPHLAFEVLLAFRARLDTQLMDTAAHADSHYLCDIENRATPTEVKGNTANNGDLTTATVFATCSSSSCIKQPKSSALTGVVGRSSMGVSASFQSGYSLLQKRQ